MLVPTNVGGTVTPKLIDVLQYCQNKQVRRVKLLPKQIMLYSTTQLIYVLEYCQNKQIREAIN